MNKSLLESNIIAVVLQNFYPEMLKELDLIQHIDVLDQVMYLSGVDAKIISGEELTGGYAKCPESVLKVYQTIQPVVSMVADNIDFSESEIEREIEVKYDLYKIKQELQDREFEQKQEYRK